MRHPLTLGFLFLLFFPALHGKDNPPDSVDFANGVRMETKEVNGWFSGLGGIRRGDRILRSGHATVYPLLARTFFDKPEMIAGLVLEEVSAVENGVDLVFRLHGLPEGSGGSFFFEQKEDGRGPLRDKFLYPRIRPVSGLVERIPDWIAGLPRPSSTREIGKLVWHIRPAERTFAGWPWAGWKWWFSGALEGEAFPKLNCFRLLSSWDSGGTLDGLTVVNHRYRGFGEPAQSLTTGAEGSVAIAWNTQDVVLQKGDEAILENGNREEILSLRRASWIQAPARGAGMDFVDYQFQEDIALFAFPERQGNLRGLTEIYPGDRTLGHYDADWFDPAREWKTVPRYYLALSSETARTEAFWRTRYLEAREAVRAQVASELDFREAEVVPTVGYLFDFWGRNDSFAPVVARMADYAPYLDQIGVKRIMVHNPGWLNGRAVQRGWDGAKGEFVGGGVNNVYDWLPLPQVTEAWKNSYTVLRELGIDYYVWITGMSQRGADFFKAVGTDPANWATHHPKADEEEMYTARTPKHFVRSDAFRTAFNERLRKVARTCGFDGFWGDSFQNLMMSALRWDEEGGHPQQREWWQWLAAQSRLGNGWIAESHSFPGISCSIETARWEDHPWLMGKTIKWLRGRAQWKEPPRHWNKVAFRLMSFGGWLAPEIWPYEVTEEVDPLSVIPSFSRLAGEFNLARPLMKRPYLLDKDKGVLWLPAETDTTAVLFAYERFPVPEGVQAWPITEAQLHPVGRTRTNHTYLLKGSGLQEAFGIVPPPRNDERQAVAPLPAGSGSPSSRTLSYAPIPGRQKTAAWDRSTPLWRPDPEQRNEPWPGNEAPWAVFPRRVQTVLPVEGKVEAAGLLVPSSELSVVLNTTGGKGVDSALFLDGPVAGPATFLFKGTLREKGRIHTPLRLNTGLQFRGGGVYDLDADLLPWPDQHHKHSPVIGLSDPGTTVHFRGRLLCKGELARPGLVLGDDTRFVVWPEAHIQLIKDYGGFTLQLWVTGTGDHGGTLELLPGFKADRSRAKLSLRDPEGEGVVANAFGSLRMGGATLITHHSRNLPMTARATGDAERPVQNNGHLVFEHRDGNRWIVRGHPQRYHGAVWIDRDLEIRTERTLTHTGVTEPPDAVYNYTAANGFQTRRRPAADHRPITIRKTGPAGLVLKGEHAYVPDSFLVIEEGHVAFFTDPAKGGLFPKGRVAEQANLHIQIQSKGRLLLAAPTVAIRSLQMQENAELVWKRPVTLEISEPVTLTGVLIPDFSSAKGVRLLKAPSIDSPESLPSSLSLREHHDSTELWYLPANVQP